jgi:hypothetical protein
VHANPSQAEACCLADLAAYGQILNAA